MKHAETESSLTDIRLKLSVIEQTLKAIVNAKSPITGREVALAYTNCQQSTMWLGKAKGTLGIKTPYSESFNPENKIIENRSDVANISADDLILSSTEVTTYKSLRKALNEVENMISSLMHSLTDNVRFQITVTNAYTYCCNATMWLGMALNVIKIHNDVIKEMTVADLEVEIDLGDKKTEGVVGADAPENTPNDAVAATTGLPVENTGETTGQQVQPAKEEGTVDTKASEAPTENN